MEMARGGEARRPGEPKEEDSARKKKRKENRSGEEGGQRKEENGERTGIVQDVIINLRSPEGEQVGESQSTMHETKTARNNAEGTTAGAQASKSHALTNAPYTFGPFPSHLSILVIASSNCRSAA